MATAEDNLWTRVIGDDWRWTFSTADTVTDWATPFAQLRQGNNSDGTLVATSATAEGVTANITITSNFSTGDLAWHIADTVTETFSPGSYWFELSATIDGDITTVLTHHLSVVDQIAVEV